MSGARVWIAACLLAPCALAGGGLPRQLAEEGDWAGAALECRRAAQGAEASDAAGWHWWAAWAYRAGGEPERALRELDRAEDADEGRVLTLQTAWLRGELALDERDWAEAGFHFAGLRMRAGGEEPWREAGTRGEALAKVHEGDGWGAAELLESLGVGGAADAAAVRGWAEGGRKRPWLGGLLGVVPGLGYAYSGEWGNALRSLILNGLFGWAMAETAMEDQWGLFAVCTFLETTWWSGSIYGGIDAAKRWNRQAEGGAANAAGGGEAWRGRVDWGTVPAVTVRFGF